MWSCVKNFPFCVIPDNFRIRNSLNSAEEVPRIRICFITQRHIFHKFLTKKSSLCFVKFQVIFRRKWRSCRRWQTKKKWKRYDDRLHQSVNNVIEKNANSIIVGGRFSVLIYCSNKIQSLHSMHFIQGYCNKIAQL